MSFNIEAKIPPKTPPHLNSSTLNNDTPLDNIMNSDLAKKIINDPLAAGIWKLYTKAQDSLPDGKRIENLIWRRMAIKLNRTRQNGTTKVFI